MKIKARSCRISLLVASTFLFSWMIGCQSTPMPSTPVEKVKIPTIAVWDLENLNQTESAAFDLGELLSDEIMETLLESGRWKVVEREQIILALEELNLSSTSMVSDSTRLEVGRLIGAQYMVFGTYMQMMQTMQLNLRLVEVETGRVLNASERSTFKEDIGIWLELAREATDELQII